MYVPRCRARLLSIAENVNFHNPERSHLKLFPMIISRITVLVIVICSACGQMTPEKKYEKEIDGLVASMLKTGSAGTSVAVAKSGQILSSKGYGSANPEYDIPNSAETIFHVASVSKQFTAFAIALLVDQEKISLDD